MSPPIEQPKIVAPDGADQIDRELDQRLVARLEIGAAIGLAETAQPVTRILQQSEPEMRQRQQQRTLLGRQELARS